MTTYLHAKKASINSPFLIMKVEGALDGEAVGTLLDEASNYGGLTAASVSFVGPPLAEPHDLWARVRAGRPKDYGTDSFYIRYPGYGPVNLNLATEKTSFYWRKVSPNPRPWANTDIINFGHREHGTLIDAIAFVLPGSEPFDEEAKAALGLGGEVPPPPPPPKPIQRTWPHPRHGIGYPMDVIAGWAPPSLDRLNAGCWHSWWPMYAGRRDTRHIPFVTQGAAVNADLWALNSPTRALGLCNEPELVGDGATTLDVYEAVDLAHRVLDTWSGYRFGLNTLCDRQSIEDYLDVWWSEYEHRYHVVPLDGIGLHFYTQVQTPFSPEDPFAFCRIEAVQKTVYVLRWIIEHQRNLNRPTDIIITEGFGLVHPSTYGIYEMEEIQGHLAELWIAAWVALTAIPEVKCIMPFSVSYHKHVANNHVHQNGQPTTLGHVFNALTRSIS